jgi:Flp pilus assembly protein TadG
MKSERGQSLVELAISLVIILYLLSGLVEFGIIFFQYIQLRDAAQEGALYGSMNPPLSATDMTREAKIAERARHSSRSPIDLLTNGNVTVDVDVTDAKYCEGGSLQVKVTYPHKVFMAFMPRIIGPEIKLEATVTDTILTPVCGP